VKYVIRMKLLLFIASLFLLVLRVKCVNILGVFPGPGYSQFILAEALMNEVVSRGHQVTVISPHTPKNAPPNYKIINTNEVIENTDGNYVVVKNIISYFHVLKANV
jgi:glucuronosyltransferase